MLRTFYGTILGLQRSTSEDDRRAGKYGDGEIPKANIMVLLRRSQVKDLKGLFRISESTMALKTYKVFGIGDNP